MELVTKADQTKVTFRIVRPCRVCIDLVVPLGDKDAGLVDAITELYAAADHCKYCDCSPESCLDCKVHQVITLIRRSTKHLSRAARPHITLTVTYEDGTRKNLGTVDEPEAVAGRLIDSIKDRRGVFNSGKVAAATAGVIGGGAPRRLPGADVRADTARQGRSVEAFTLNFDGIHLATEGMDAQSINQ